MYDSGVAQWVTLVSIFKFNKSKKSQMLSRVPLEYKIQLQSLTSSSTNNYSQSPDISYMLPAYHNQSLHSFLFGQHHTVIHIVFLSVVSIPAPFEPPVRTLRATIPVQQSHCSGGRNYHSGNQETVTQIPYTVVMHRLV